VKNFWASVYLLFSCYEIVMMIFAITGFMVRHVHLSGTGSDYIWVAFMQLFFLTAILPVYAGMERYQEQISQVSD
jgi:hypothetical protein